MFLGNSVGNASGEAFKNAEARAMMPSMEENIKGW